jgi:hypothetical protein
MTVTYNNCVNTYYKTLHFVHEVHLLASCNSQDKKRLFLSAINKYVFIGQQVLPVTQWITF